MTVENQRSLIYKPKQLQRKMTPKTNEDVRVNRFKNTFIV